jgi:hypothetical protein
MICRPVMFFLRDRHTSPGLFSYLMNTKNGAIDSKWVCLCLE